MATTNNNVTFSDYVEALVLAKGSPSLRYGQQAFNLLDDVHPELAALVRNTEHDPFFDDDKMGDFLNWLDENWF